MYVLYYWFPPISVTVPTLLEVEQSYELIYTCYPTVIIWSSFTLKKNILDYPNYRISELTYTLPSLNI